MNVIEGGVCAAKGFTAGGIHAGIKKDPDKKDLAIIYCEKKCNTSVLFTTNKVKAAPIMKTMKHVADGIAQAIVVNSGNANACTANGMEIAEKMCGLTADSLGISKEDVIVASTGVIGQELEIKPFELGIHALAKGLSQDGSDNAVHAIMTTDTFPKQIAVEFELDGGIKCKIGGIAKGSGMINPNMATMLAFITTDVKISGEMLQKALRYVNDNTFNMVSVDGDTSTNDMVCIMASGLTGNEEITCEDENYGEFIEALHEVMVILARKMARDGEGATKLLTCLVEGAPDNTAAKSVAKSVISSSLVKAALGAADANWGRVLCAIGYAEGEFDISKVKVKLVPMYESGIITVCDNGVGVPFSEEEALKALSKEEIMILIELHSGEARAIAWGCDLTAEYVRINADYRS